MYTCKMQDRWLLCFPKVLTYTIKYSFKKNVSHKWPFKMRAEDPRQPVVQQAQIFWSNRASSGKLVDGWNDEALRPTTNATPQTQSRKVTAHNRKHMKTFAK